MNLTLTSCDYAEDHPALRMGAVIAAVREWRFTRILRWDEEEAVLIYAYDALRRAEGVE